MRNGPRENVLTVLTMGALVGCASGRRAPPATTPVARAAAQPAAELSSPPVVAPEPAPPVPHMVVRGQCPEARVDRDPPSVPAPAGTVIARALEHLAPAWDADLAVDLVLSPALFYVRTPRPGWAAATLDARTGRLVTSLEGTVLGNFEPVLASAAGLLIAQTAPGSLRALRLPRGEQAWTADVGVAQIAVAHRRAGDLVLAFDRERVQALDAATGVTRWTFEVPSPHDFVADLTVWQATETRLFYRNPYGVAALDPDTGCMRWWAEVASEYNATFAANDRFAVVVGERLQVLSPSTGELVASASRPNAVRAWDSGAYAASLRDDTLVVWIESSPGPVAAIDLRTARTLWSHGDEVHFVAVADDAVFMSTIYGVVSARDRQTGALRWMRGYVGDRTPAGLVAVPGLPGGAGVLVASMEGTTLFTRGVLPVAQPAVTVRGVVRVDGRPTPGFTVQVGDAQGRTDNTGQYAVEVVGTGEINVHVIGRRAAQNRVVRLDPRRPVVDLDFDLGPPAPDLKRDQEGPP